jgi:class 3 adenylate cyclase/tetratricopeptide (TPR) repeat protein
MELFTDDPEAYLAADRRFAISEGRSLPDRVRGSGLFADISGFTPLTEALAKELGPQRGSEELSRNLNRVLHAVIEQVDLQGGDVIYFAGDAITAWFDGDDGSRGAAAGLAIQRTMAEVGHVVTPAGTEVVLAIKVAIAVGNARRFVVGDPSVQLLDVLAGRIVDELADAEHLAEKGDVVLARSAITSLADRFVAREHRTDDESGSLVDVLDHLLELPPVMESISVHRDLDEELVRPWLLPVVYQRLTAGRGEFFSEMRSAYPVFLRFGGIDFDDDPDADTKLDRFVRVVQTTLSSYGGNLLQLNLGDKGAYLYGVFGSPHAHENDAARACAAALDLLSLDDDLAVADLQIGITHGRLFSGTSGHALRRTFTCLGDSVNLAARLMSKAPAGQAYVSEEVRDAVGDSLVSEFVGDMVVKGKTEGVRVHSLVGVRRGPVKRGVRYPLPMVGRDDEMATLLDARDLAAQGAGQFVGVAAEAGRGKSRLISELVRGLPSAGFTVAWGEAQSLGRTSSYLVWREVWRTIFGLDDEASDAQQRRALELRLEGVAPGHSRRAPLLAGLLGIDIDDNDLTSSFDAKLRKTSLESLLVDAFRARAADGPLAVVLEDCHIIDPLSRDLLEALVRSAAALPVVFYVAYRPVDVPGGDLGLGELPYFREIVLGELGPNDARKVIDAKARQLFGAEVVCAPVLVDLMIERAQGNPFYIEELVSYLYGIGIDPADPEAVAHLNVPVSLQRLVLSRIDMLDEAPRSTLKVASVVGRSFDTPSVHGVYPELGTVENVDDLLDTAARAELLNVDRVEDRSWLFRHIVTREVAYESLPFGTRTMLHERAGAHLEALGADVVEQSLDLLAYHYLRSEVVDKKRDYVLRAGIAAQARYANDAAADYFRTALPLVDDIERVPLLRRLGKVLELRGGWADAEATFSESAELAATLGLEAERARSLSGLAECLRKQGRFDDARAQLAIADEIFTNVGDEAGLGVVFHLRGTLSSQQGRYDEARAAYEASLEIRERLGDRAAVGSLLSNLAVVAENEGDLETARVVNRRALEVREEVGDRWAISVSLNNLGMVDHLLHDYAAAERRFEASMQLAAEVGDRWIVAYGHHNLGNARLGLGHLVESSAEFLEALAAYEDFGDRWSLSLLIEDVVPLAIALDKPFEALQLVGAADALRRELDAPRPPATVALLDATIAAAASTIDLTEGDARRLGEQLDAAELSDLIRGLGAPATAG